MFQFWFGIFNLITFSENIFINLYTEHSADYTDINLSNFLFFYIKVQKAWLYKKTLCVAFFSCKFSEVTKLIQNARWRGNIIRRFNSSSKIRSCRTLRFAGSYLGGLINRILDCSLGLERIPWPNRSWSEQLSYAICYWTWDIPLRSSLFTNPLLSGSQSLS